MKGRGRLFYLVISSVQIMSWVGVTTSRNLAPHNGAHDVPLSGTGTDQTPQSLQFSFSQKEESRESMAREVQMETEEIYEGVNKIGSSPPSCEHKCFGCMPCEPTQVPTTTSRVGLQYANYEPEGWKCKCGPSFYGP